MAENEIEVPQYEIEIVAQPEIKFVNFEVLKSFISGLLEKYKGLVITEDQCKDIKKEMAQLNKIKASIREYSKGVVEKLRAPIDKIELYVLEISNEIDATYASLKGQTDAFAEKEREEKKKSIIQSFENLCRKFAIAPWSLEIKKQWTNKTTPFSKIEEELSAIVQARVAQIMREREQAAAAKQQAQDVQTAPQLMQNPQQPVQSQPQPIQKTEPTAQANVDLQQAPPAPPAAPQTSGIKVEQAAPQVESQSPQQVASPTVTTMSIVVTWSGEVDGTVRELLRQVKRLSMQFSARRIATPLTEGTAKKEEPKPQMVEKDVKFCGTCDKFDSSAVPEEGYGICRKTGEKLCEFTAGC